MQVQRSWRCLLGTLTLALLPLVRAGQISDPNLAVIREFNVILTDNSKLNDLSCCMGAPNEMFGDKQYFCFPHLEMGMSQVPGARRIGFQVCSHLPGSDPIDAQKTFEAACKQREGEVLSPDRGFCPQVWPNYREGYKKPAPAQPAQPAEPVTKPPPPTDPDATGKNTNDKDGFKTEGTFLYSLVDNAITQSLACCKGSSKPIVTPKNYKCAQRKVANSVFMQQCAKVLMSITNPKKLHGYTTLSGEGDTIVDEDTKQQCSAMWTNAVSYTYGFCKLDYDQIAETAVKDFTDDCTAKGGESKQVHNGMCLWNVDDAAADSGST